MAAASATLGSSVPPDHDQSRSDRRSFPHRGGHAQRSGGHRGDDHGEHQSLREDRKVEIRGFGSFRTRQRAGRIGRNPKTGEAVKVPPKTIPFFKPSKELQELINRE